MKIAIIGAGNVGRALGGAWRTDHDITYGVRSPDDAKYADLDAPTATNETAVAGTDVVVLCTPWQGTEQAVKACGDLTGKVLIDCTNPLTPDASALEIGHTTSGAEQVAAWAPGARVCKAMNQIGAPSMDHPQFPAAPVMFVCGDDEAAQASDRRPGDAAGLRGRRRRRPHAGPAARAVCVDLDPPRAATRFRRQLGFWAAARILERNG